MLATYDKSQIMFFFQNIGRILLVQSFTARMPLLAATSAF